MSNEKSTLANRGREVIVGHDEETGKEITYTVMPFKVGKTLVGLELLAEFFEEGEIAAILQNSQQSFVSVLAEKLPTLIRTARPKLFELLAVILITNKKIRDAEDDGSLDELIKHHAKELRDVAEAQAVFDILDAGIDMMGVEDIRKNVSRLLTKFRPKTETTTPEA